MTWRWPLALTLSALAAAARGALQCPSPARACPDGTALGPGKVCDGKADCPDSWDETGCNTFYKCWSCANNPDTCYELQRCDHVSDCQDGSDEQGCTFSCP